MAMPPWRRLLGRRGATRWLCWARSPRAISQREACLHLIKEAFVGSPKWTSMQLRQGQIRRIIHRRKAKLSGDLPRPLPLRWDSKLLNRQCLQHYEGRFSLCGRSFLPEDHFLSENAVRLNVEEGRGDQVCPFVGSLGEQRIRFLAVRFPDDHFNGEAGIHAHILQRAPVAQRLGHRGPGLRDCRGAFGRKGSYVETYSRYIRTTSESARSGSTRWPRSCRRGPHVEQRWPSPDSRGGSTRP